MPVLGDRWACLQGAAGLINSPDTHKNGSVVAQACCFSAGHLTLDQRVAAGLGPGHGNRRKCRLGLLASFVFMEGTGAGGRVNAPSQTVCTQEPELSAASSIK